jgi:hypothetical protein
VTVRSRPVRVPLRPPADPVAMLPRRPKPLLAQALCPFFRVTWPHGHCTGGSRAGRAWLRRRAPWVVARIGNGREKPQPRRGRPPGLRVTRSPCRARRRLNQERNRRGNGNELMAVSPWTGTKGLGTPVGCCQSWGHPPLHYAFGDQGPERETDRRAPRPGRSPHPYTAQIAPREDTKKRSSGRGRPRRPRILARAAPRGIQSRRHVRRLPRRGRGCRWPTRGRSRTGSPS